VFKVNSGYHSAVPQDHVLLRQKALSRIAFGQEWRLPVILAVLELGESSITQSGVARHLGVDPSSIQKAFTHLVELELLVPEPVAGQRYKFYAVADSVLWEYAVELEKRCS